MNLCEKFYILAFSCILRSMSTENSILPKSSDICCCPERNFDTTWAIFHKGLKGNKNTGKTLYYLSEASGMQLDYISKMSKGKGNIPRRRAPDLSSWCDGMHRNTRADLLFLYRQEKWERASGNVWKNWSVLSSRMWLNFLKSLFLQVFQEFRYGYDAGQYLCNLCVCIRKAMINASDSTICLCTPKFHWNIYDILFRHSWSALSAD